MKRKTILLSFLVLVFGTIGFFSSLIVPEIIKENKTESIVAELGDSNGLSFERQTFDATSGNYGSVNIKATVEVNSSDKSISWWLEWSNQRAEWVDNKEPSDYIELDSNDTGATVTCIQPFGEQIVLNACLSADPSVSTSMTLDFYKRIEGVTLSLLSKTGTTSSIVSGKGTQTWDWGLGSGVFTYGRSISMLQNRTESLSLNFGVGTIETPLSSYQIKFRQDQNYLQRTNFGSRYSSQWFTCPGMISPASLFTCGLYNSVVNGSMVPAYFLSDFKDVTDTTPIDFQFQITLNFADSTTKTYSIYVNLKMMI